MKKIQFTNGRYNDIENTYWKYHKGGEYESDEPFYFIRNSYFTGRGETLAKAKTDFRKKLKEHCEFVLSQPIQSATTLCKKYDMRFHL